MNDTDLQIFEKSGLPIPEKEYEFHPTRKWKFDYAFVKYKVYIEIEGGIYSKGRHVRPKGFIGDMEKYNAASELGWRMLRYKHVTKINVDQIKKTLFYNTTSMS